MTEQQYKDLLIATAKMSDYEHKDEVVEALKVASVSFQKEWAFTYHLPDHRQEYIIISVVPDKLIVLKEHEDFVDDLCKHVQTSLSCCVGFYNRSFWQEICASSKMAMLIYHNRKKRGLSSKTGKFSYILLKIIAGENLTGKTRMVKLKDSVYSWLYMHLSRKSIYAYA